jgi:hypothetical protein
VLAALVSSFLVVLGAFGLANDGHWCALGSSGAQMEDLGAIGGFTLAVLSLLLGVRVIWTRRGLAWWGLAVAATIGLWILGANATFSCGN